MLLVVGDLKRLLQRLVRIVDLIRQQKWHRLVLLELVRQDALQSFLRRFVFDVQQPLDRIVVEVQPGEQTEQISDVRCSIRQLVEEVLDLFLAIVVDAHIDTILNHVLLLQRGQ